MRKALGTVIPLPIIPWPLAGLAPAQARRQKNRGKKFLVFIFLTPSFCHCLFRAFKAFGTKTFFHNLNPNSSPDGLAQLRHHHVGQAQLFPQRQQVRQTKARIGPHRAQANMGWQVLPKVQQESHGIVPARGVARSPPKLSHQTLLRQHGQKRTQTGLESPFGLTHRHTFLLAVFVRQTRGIQSQRVAFRTVGQAMDAPLPQRTKATQIPRRRTKTRKETRQRGLAGHPQNV
jgi:hypothetical protein